MKKEAVLVFLLLVSSILVYACVSGESRECGNDVGECRKGTQNCVNEVWSSCIGSVGPKDESCFDNLDNDCDGIIDENCNCIEGNERECGIGNLSYANDSYCRKGKETCVNNTWSNCIGFIGGLVTEICNNKIDDNCNGIVDENCNVNISSSCSDRVCNGDEDCAKGITNQVDCGGKCIACVNCKDGILNQNEEKVKQNLGNGTISDCGGNCVKCPSCSDNIKNQNEEDIDCGGVCKPCIKDSDGDGLLDEQEGKIGTNINLKDSDEDGIDDKEDKMPLCPNQYCNEFYNETKENCPEDCGKEIKFNYWAIVMVLIPVIVFGIWFLIRKFKIVRFIYKKKQ